MNSFDTVSIRNPLVGLNNICHGTYPSMMRCELSHTPGQQSSLAPPSDTTIPSHPIARTHHDDANEIGTATNKHAATGL
jgi:hypothetical protein